MTNEMKPDAIRQGTQMTIFWRIMQLLIRRYGNNPMGQTLVVLTMVFLNERGMPPTLTQLCKATGLPKASVSRYVSSQIREGLVEEIIDSKDRRRRLLVQTEKGKREWDEQFANLNKIFTETEERMGQLKFENERRPPEVLLERMSGVDRDVKKYR